MNKEFYSGAHGNQSRHNFEPKTISGVKAVNGTFDLFRIPAGTDINKIFVRYSGVTLPSANRLNFGLVQRDQIGRKAGEWTDDPDALGQDNAVATNGRKWMNDVQPSVNVDEHDVWLVAQVRAGAFVAASTVTLEVSLEYESAGTP